jgi:tRNA-modifying protein YgfZ
MNLIWQAYLRNRGAIIQDGRVVDYGDNAAELESTRSATVVSDLSHFGLIHFSGEDAQSFLQGQLSCDVKQVNASAALYGGYCNPKGRLLASLLIWSQSSSNGGGYVMQLPAALRAGIQKRLAMYVLRAKVKLADTSDIQIRLGVAGDDAEALVRKNMGEIPASRLGIIHGESASIIRLAQNRFELVIAPEKASAIWEGLSRDAVPVGASCWDWLEIKAGIPIITPATQEQFVPQMANLEAIGGVSFQKGCYPGQEIVARSQYLGKIKRRMYLANIRPGISENPVEAGNELFGADMGEQSIGMVVNASPSPEGGFDVLAVIQVSSVEAAAVHWKSLAGPSLKITPLPYSLS